MGAPNWIRWAGSCIRTLTTGPQRLAFLPALTLGAYLFLGEAGLITAALTVPLLVALTAQGRNRRRAPSQTTLGKDDLGLLADDVLATAREGRRATACLMIWIDGLPASANGPRFAASTVHQRLFERTRSVLRHEDTVHWLGPKELAVVLSPSLNLTHDPMMALARRVQAALEEPLNHDGQSLYVSAAVGVAISADLPRIAVGHDLVQAASRALFSARQHGVSSIRADHKAPQPRNGGTYTGQEAVAALGAGQIQPWFQPQICTDTGRISGVEALARWHKPEVGLIPPNAFLPALEDAGAMEQLGAAMLSQSLAALTRWDRQGLDIPRVSVNLSDPELHNPTLADKILWELDRFDLPPRRLTIEVLETVVTHSADDVCCRTLDRLARAGCRIDLDDFGTGNASIAALQRMTLHCLKIDRSFVSRIDKDESRRRLVAALLGMAERLDLETVAEGVETPDEHAILAQLGCTHVQGFGIARPMPADTLSEWARHHVRTSPPVSLPGRGSGAAP